MLHKRLKNAQPHDAIVRSTGAWGTSLNKRLAAIWIAKSIACHYCTKLGITTINLFEKPTFDIQTETLLFVS